MSERRHPKDEEELADKTHILLFLSQESDRTQLAKWLSSSYEVVFPENRTPEEIDFDLCILDEVMLAQHRESLEQAKTEAKPGFLPYLLVSTTVKRRPLEDDVWDTVDEVISAPTRKKTLHNRLSNLLKRRELSHQLATELSQQRELFQKVFEYSNDAIVVVDQDQQAIRACNPQACELFGYTREEFRSLSPREMCLNTPAIEEFFQTVATKGSDQIAEISCQTKHGESLKVEISASQIELDNRSHILASIRDLTTLHEQQRILNSLHDVTAELMEAETKQDVAETTVDAAKDVFEYKIAGVRLLDTATDPETLELVAATPETWERLQPDPSPYEVGEGLVGTAFAQDNATLVENLESVESPLEYGTIRSAMCLPLGEHGVLSIGSPSQNAFDDLDFELMRILATNATAALTRAQREATLRERKEYLGELFENATDSIADVEFVDGTPHICDVNERFEHVFGYDAEDIQGDSLVELVVPSGEEYGSEWLIKHALNGNGVETEARRETAVGLRDFLIRVVPIQQDGTTIGAYIVYTDITQRKQRDQQLQVLNRIFRHNIRNKLTVIWGIIEEALDDDSNIPDGIAKNSRDAVEALAKICETARELAEEKQPQRNAKAIAVTEVIDQTVEAIEQEFPEAIISTDMTAEPHIASSIQLRRALSELCENAIEHANRSDPSVEISATPASDTSGWVEITVADDGPGIPAEQQEVLEAGKETQLKHANGLGLWVVNWIVTGSGGDLSLGDPHHGGAAVTMRLPTVKAEGQPQEGVRVIPANE